MNLLSRVKVTPVLEIAASGTVTASSAILDMAGWDGVAFIGSVETSDTTHNLAVWGGSATTAVNEPLVNTAVKCHNKTPIVEVYRPRKRYIRAVLIRKTTSVVVAITAIQYKGARDAGSHTGTATGAAFGRIVVSPDTGTASDTA